MRNEGPFLVEWLCWYRMLGFNDAVVVTNNCTDHSPELLDALQAAGWVQHIRHEVEPGKPITRAKLAAAATHKSVRRADWLMICDVDEFLVIHRGAGLIGDLIDLKSPQPAYLGMSICWKVFGTSGVDQFEDRPVHRQFTQAHDSSDRSSRFVKSIFRLPGCFINLAEHSPTKFNAVMAAKKQAVVNRVWVNAKGEAIEAWQAGETYFARMPQDLVTHEVAQINHYMLRSYETYRLKHGTKSPVALKNRYRPAYFNAANSGIFEDTSALRYADRFDAVYAEAMRLPDVARLHALCCADHVAAINKKAGKRGRADKRYAAFMAEAEALAGVETASG
jgi:Glycosyl transferase family 2